MKVGVAAQLPSGANRVENYDFQSFFQFLLEGGAAYERIPAERFNTERSVSHRLHEQRADGTFNASIRGKGLGQILTDTGTFLKGVHLFDNLEFGVSEKDARLLSLSTRKLIETAFLSLVDSGIDYRGQNVGCYVSGVAHDMLAVSGHVSRCKYRFPATGRTAD